VRVDQREGRQIIERLIAVHVLLDAFQLFVHDRGLRSLIGLEQRPEARHTTTMNGLMADVTACRRPTCERRESRGNHQMGRPAGSVFPEDARLSGVRRLPPEPLFDPPRRSIVTQGMSRNTWIEQLRRGGLDLAILLAVANGPRYGLAIIQHLEAFTDLVVGEGTIYPILGRLTKEGLLDANWVEDEAPHPRKYYRLTKPGRTRLREMKAEWRAFAEKIDRLIAATTEGERR
jgi:PadR family transcriptional regulator PadR